MSATIKDDEIDKGILAGAGVPPLSSDDGNGKGARGGTYGGISVIRRGKVKISRGRYKLSGRRNPTRRRKKYANHRSILASKPDDTLNCKAGSNMNPTKSVRRKGKHNA